MRFTYARDVDAMAVWFAPGATTIGAREIAPDTYAEFDKDGRLLGIEVLNAGAYSRWLPPSRPDRRPTQ
jgi:uncharacterized protein YuzE